MQAGFSPPEVLDLAARLVPQPSPGSTICSGPTGPVQFLVNLVQKPVLGSDLGLPTETITQFIGFGLGLPILTEPNRYDERQTDSGSDGRRPGASKELEGFGPGRRVLVINHRHVCGLEPQHRKLIPY